MSHKHRNHNYTNYSKPQPQPQPVVEVKEEPVVAPVVDDPVVTPDPEPTPILGVVAGCEKLNVREEASLEAGVVCELVKNTEVMIDEENSTNDFYKICTGAGVEGFCMNKFITIKS